MVPKPLLSFPFQNIELSSSLLWAGLGIFFVFYMIVSAVLVFHWREYGMSSKAILLAEFVFYAVTAFLFFLACVIIVTI